MKVEDVKQIITIVAVVLALALLTWNSEAASIRKLSVDSSVMDNNRYPLRTVDQIDGDTYTALVVLSPHPIILHLVNIREFGIDTPEKGPVRVGNKNRAQCQAEADLSADAKEFAAAWLEENKHELHIVMQSKSLGRTVARTFNSDFENLGEALIKAGLARDCDGPGCRRSWCGTDGESQ